MDKHRRQDRDWKWHYSFWTGVMYGPIPVGIIVGFVVVACYTVYKFLL